MDTYCGHLGLQQLLRLLMKTVIVVELAIVQSLNHAAKLVHTWLYYYYNYHEAECYCTALTRLQGCHNLVTWL